VIRLYFSSKEDGQSKRYFRHVNDMQYIYILYSTEQVHLLGGTEETKQTNTVRYDSGV